MVYWPTMNVEIENLILISDFCAMFRSENNKELIAHEIPNIQFQKIACDIIFGQNGLFE